MNMVDVCELAEMMVFAPTHPRNPFGIDGKFSFV